ncbi:hypothetical protein SALB_03309 [Streptomyces noursei]|uniref:Uncharacterized protein n=1 Tax=Streptomyces noursei TaxID=1971 RepID=A0A401QZ23_STRNR|nr:hypothetical protein SALB_03309 [Streptomyces noursei]
MSAHRPPVQVAGVLDECQALRAQRLGRHLHPVVTRVVGQAAGGAVHLLGDRDRLAVGERRRVPLQVLDVDPRQQVARRLGLLAHRNRHRGNPLHDPQFRSEVHTGLVRVGQVDSGQRPRAAGDALRQFAAQPDRLDPVGGAGELPREAPLGHQRFREHRLLRYADGELPGPIGALGDHRPVQAHLCELQRIGVGVLVDRQFLDRDEQRRHAVPRSPFLVRCFRFRFRACGVVPSPGLSGRCPAPL